MRTLDIEVKFRLGDEFSTVFNEAANESWAMTSNPGRLKVTRTSSDGAYSVSTVPEQPGTYELEFTRYNGGPEPNARARCILHVRPA